MKTTRPVFVSLVIAINFLAIHTKAEPSIWPQWRGPNRDGQISGVTWPDKLDTNHLREVWRVELGPSYSGPIVGADQVFTTETKDKKYEIVAAFDRSTGKQLWRAQWEGALSVPFFAKSNGDWVRSTPALDGDRLYVAGMRDVLVCLDARGGKEVWRKDFVKELKTPLPDFGFTCQPEPVRVARQTPTQRFGILGASRRRGPGSLRARAERPRRLPLGRSRNTGGQNAGRLDFRSPTPVIAQTSIGAAMARASQPQTNSTQHDRKTPRNHDKSIHRLLLRFGTHHEDGRSRRQRRGFRNRRSGPCSGHSE